MGVTNGFVLVFFPVVRKGFAADVSCVGYRLQ